MSREVNEALLEMHFYRPLADFFEASFGRKVLKIVKPSQQDEAWIGFDVGWAKTPSTTTLGRDLKVYVQGSAGAAPSLLLGFFLQFKVVDEIHRRSTTLPKNVSPPIQPPYYRSELSLLPNKQSGMSQHETLMRLATLPDTAVAYACPMLLTEDELHAQPTLDMLRIVPVDTAPQGWVSTQRHFIVFRKKDDDPLWCSDAVQGRSVSPTDWIASLRRFSPDELLHWVGSARALLRERPGDQKEPFPHSMWIVVLGGEAG